MPSLIPGYEYDIFISYRQKDNKGDRWVSEFLETPETHWAQMALFLLHALHGEKSVFLSNA